MPLATFPLGPLQTNSYLLHIDKEAVAVDVGGDPSAMLSYLATHDLVLQAICITHMHFDHLYGVAKLAQETAAPVLIPKGDQSILDTEASQGGIWGFPTVAPFASTFYPETGDMELAGAACTILKTPGHTPGGICLYFPTEKLVFVGDTLFYRSVGRTDFPGGSSKQLLASITEQLFTLPDETRVLPGHGPETNIGDERINNPFCGDFRA